MIRYDLKYHVQCCVADILSNGNNPPAVCRHLTKLYDNLAVLVFPKAGSKHAFEMISKENEEHVPFKAPCCDCSGKVGVDSLSYLLTILNLCMRV